MTRCGPWLTVAAVAGALVAFLLARSRWRGCASCACCQVWGALRRQLLSPGTRASAHYRPVRAEDPDDTETALLLDAPLEEQRSPRPAARRRPAGHSPPPPDMTDICLDPALRLVTTSCCTVCPYRGLNVVCAFCCCSLSPAEVKVAITDCVPAE
ncbi:hypothetical protein FJT64_014575 [Amphibalanus amphitrite]|uniref:Uncharacterized protein n=1 Tax=Amphibalanus amphitrite TaxID=1232801 RepID=A0A6A4UW98_AMPAM|nr:hypothetical protein FJT64_014575 [Amphibalanus amphitrite]